MKSTAATPEAYIASLPPERAQIITAVRQTILDNLPLGYQEAMNWGMISYEVPLAIVPKTYNGQPLLYAALASQKNNCALYLLTVHSAPNLKQQLDEGFEAIGKKPNMGKSCIRFKSISDIPLSVIGEIIASVPLETFVSRLQTADLASRKSRNEG